MISVDTDETTDTTKKILVMEDDKDIREVTEIILRDNGFDVTTTSTGERIKCHIMHTQPDLILMDVWVPGNDVKQLTRFLKDSQDTKHIPILLFSATSNIRELVREIGADDYIAKPFSIDEMIDKLTKYLYNE